MRRPIQFLQILFAAVVTAAILLQGLSGIARHLPQAGPEITTQFTNHEDKHDPLADTIWFAHGHSQDVADHDHNPVLALIFDARILMHPRTKERSMAPPLAVWNMKSEPERPPRG